ncbi:MAG TPA: hypothetical protein VEJ63_23470 [Planctomycetota bacterium]|nr:hypothetical protein [Planctomycetota bacterium]
MPATTENIPDKPKFDVYAMLIILTFLATLGATLMLNDNLDKVWGFWIPPENRKERSVHITVMNENENSDRVKISERDMKEWYLAAEQVYGGKQENFTETNFEWPQGYDVNQHPVMPNKNNLETIPENVRNALMAGYRGGAAAPAGEAPKPEAAPAPAGGGEAPKANQ